MHPHEGQASQQPGRHEMGEPTAMSGGRAVISAHPPHNHEGGCPFKALPWLCLRMSPGKLTIFARIIG